MSLTNISFPEEQADALRQAIAYYRFDSINMFFRVCAKALIEHHRNEDKLVMPLRFEARRKRRGGNGA